MNIKESLDERMGWKTIKEILFDRKIPHVNWWYTLGSIAMFLFIMQAVTGILLAMYYSPSPDHARDSVLYITREVPLGAFVRGLHVWGASVLIVVVILHMLRVFFMGAYKYPREATWLTGVCLLLVVVGFGFTGYLLPWDQKAYWATVVGTSIAGQIPLLGQSVVKILRGGAEIGAITLTRFYAIHVLILPAITLIFLASHLFLVIWHGISAPPERMKKGGAS